MRSNAGPMWVSNRRIYLNAEGKAVEEGDKSKVRLLVAEGGKILQSEAVRLGLIEVTPGTVKVIEPESTSAEPAPELDAGQEPEKKAVKPAKDKAVKPAKDK